MASGLIQGQKSLPGALNQHLGVVLLLGLLGALTAFVSFRLSKFAVDQVCPLLFFYSQLFIKRMTAHC